MFGNTTTIALAPVLLAAQDLGEARVIVREVEEDVYLARERNRMPRTRGQLALLIDDSVLREALGD